MSALDDGGPAFPAICKSVNGVPLQTGMTLRDYFAAKAMQGLLSDPDIGVRYKDADGTPEWIEKQVAFDVASTSYLYADAMLAARAPKLDFSMDQKDFEAECSAMLNNGIAQFLIGKELVQFFDEWELVIPPDARERLRVLVEAVKEDAKGGAA